MVAEQPFPQLKIGFRMTSEFKNQAPITPDAILARDKQGMEGNGYRNGYASSGAIDYMAGSTAAIHACHVDDQESNRANN
jgi:hypothetical protein